MRKRDWISQKKNISELNGVDTLCQFVGQSQIAECEVRVTGYRGRVKDGEAKRKLGLIAGCGLTPSPHPPFAFM